MKMPFVGDQSSDQRILPTTERFEDEASRKKEILIDVY
jgi:hypothetical protein